MEEHVVVLNELRLRIQELSQLLNQRQATSQRLLQQYEELRAKYLEQKQQIQALSEQKRKLVIESETLEATARFVEFELAVASSKQKSTPPKQASPKKKKSDGRAKRKNQKNIIAKTKKTK
ncbi:unnamed protein product [Caenorhabditis brenneri]